MNRFRSVDIFERLIKPTVNTKIGVNVLYNYTGMGPRRARSLQNLNQKNPPICYENRMGNS